MEVNVTDVWPYIWIGITVVLVLLFQFSVTWFLTWRNRDKFTLNRNGLVKITPEAIRSLKRPKVPGQKGYFPSRLWEYIQPYSCNTLSKWVLRVSDTRRNGECPENLLDVCRAMTIAAALYDKWLPVTLAQLDGRTRVLYEAVKLELGYNVFAQSTYKAIANTAPEEVVERARLIKVHLEAVGQQLFINTVVQGNHTSFECFADAVIITVKKTTGTKLTPGEVKSLVNAYSALTTTLIPVQYIDTVGLKDPSGLTTALIFYRPPAVLKVVKGVSKC